ncbi:MAG: hypothetical protein WHS85_10335 [Hydrogenophilus sp.]
MRQAIGTGGAVKPTASPPHVPHAEESEAVARLAALARGWRWLVGGVALAFSCYQLVVAAFHPWSSQLIREWHVAFLLALTFLLYPARRLAAAAAPPVRGGGIGGLLLALGAASLALYYGVFEHDLILRAGDPTQADLVVGVALLILVFEAARRVLGWPLPLLCALFLLYALFVWPRWEWCSFGVVRDETRCIWCVRVSSLGRCRHYPLAWLVRSLG